MLESNYEIEAGEGHSGDNHHLGRDYRSGRDQSAKKVVV